MPYVNVQITEGATREQKAEIVKDITNSLSRVLGKKPEHTHVVLQEHTHVVLQEHTHVVLQEIKEENWGFAGLLTDDWKKT